MAVKWEKREHELPVFSQRKSCIAVAINRLMILLAVASCRTCAWVLGDRD